MPESGGAGTSKEGMSAAPQKRGGYATFPAAHPASPAGLPVLSLHGVRGMPRTPSSSFSAPEIT